ncbi:hypothetical protein [Cypionkella sp.]|jgi:hypothetical protein|nr:hypothetical protein [Cypionkella sp.]
MTLTKISALLCVLALMGCGAAGDPVAPDVTIKAEARVGIATN